MNIGQLETMTLTDLRGLSKDYEIQGASRMKKEDLIIRIMQADAQKRGLELRGGVLEEELAAVEAQPPARLRRPPGAEAVVLPRPGAVVYCPSIDRFVGNDGAPLQFRPFSLFAEGGHGAEALGLARE